MPRQCRSTVEVEAVEQVDQDQGGPLLGRERVQRGEELPPLIGDNPFDGDTDDSDDPAIGGARATFTATKRLGNDQSRLSRIKDGKWVVVSDYLK